jgi:hypothetical protein
MFTNWIIPIKPIEKDLGGKFIWVVAKSLESPQPISRSGFSVAYSMESLKEEGQTEGVADCMATVDVDARAVGTCEPLEDLTKSIGAMTLPLGKEPPTTPYAAKKAQFNQSDLQTPLPCVRNQSFNALREKEKYKKVTDIIAEKAPRIVRVQALEQVTTGLVVGTHHVVTSVHDAIGPFQVLFSNGESYIAFTENDNEELSRLGVVATGAEISVLRMSHPASFLSVSLDALPVLTEIDLSCIIFAGYNGGTDDLKVSVDTGIRMAWTSAAKLALPLSDCQMVWNGGKSTGKIDRQETNVGDVVTVSVTSPAQRVHTFASDGESSAKLDKCGNTIKAEPDAVVMIPNMQDGNNLILGNKTAAGGSGGIYFTRDGGILGIHVGAEGEFRLAVIPWSTSKPNFPDSLDSITLEAKKKPSKKTGLVVCRGDLDNLVVALDRIDSIESGTYLGYGLFRQLKKAPSGKQELFLALVPDERDQRLAGEIIPHIHIYSDVTKEAFGHLKHSKNSQDNIPILLSKVFCKEGKIENNLADTGIFEENWFAAVTEANDDRTKAQNLLTNSVELFRVLNRANFQLKDAGLMLEVEDEDVG